ncbi:MAG: hypothetical protein EPO68_17915 [Planctomycetota bacterium]|nr:MAG: hypothetical protein EPO68_17915 [Planctomycetota bacterium]
MDEPAPESPALEPAPTGRLSRLAAQHRPRAERWMKTAPVWVPLVLAAHIALLGMLPAFLESRRLSNEEQALSARIDAANQRGLELERLRRAQQDPTYLEREARAARYGTGTGTAADAGAAGAEQPASTPSSPR